MSVSSASTSHASHSTSYRTLSLSRCASHASTSTSKHRLKGPVASSISRQEARLGVTTNYKDLALHSAAANGNVGLVQYALANGQPVNSVMNGVLPLHAAASSGNETVVRMLIDAGADVNSPRLPRGYSNERSKSSGTSVGTAGSTPLHFAAANGHVAIVRLLLSFGADPRLLEKHGVSPEAIALQNGHLDVAEALRSWSPPPPSSAGDRGDDDVASLLSSRSSFRHLSLAGEKGKRRFSSSLHPQRSFDALATKLHQHASSTSLHSLASLASAASAGASPNPSTSQISLGAAVSPSLSADSSFSGQKVGRRISLPPRPHRRLHGEGNGSSTRRPSLPSVWEKAAHPGNTLKQALGFNSAHRNGRASVAERLEAVAGSSSGSLSSSLWAGERMPIELEEAEEDEEEGHAGAERAEHCRSMEVHRPLRRDSFQGRSQASSTTSSPTLPPASAAGNALSTLPPPAIPALVRAASQHQFYRPRQSSQLSTQSFSSRRPSLDDDEEDGGDGAEQRDGVFEDSPPPSTATSPARPRAFSNPNPHSAGNCSPLLQQAHFNQKQQLTSSRQREASAASTAEGSTVTPSSSRPSTGGGAFADGELSSAESASQGGSGASRTRGPPPGDVRKTWSTQQPPSSSSSSAYPHPNSSKPPTAVAAARARSNSASTDSSLAAPTRFSSSPGSTQSGPTFSTYAPSSSTAPTSVAPSSPGAGARAAFIPTGKRGLAPLYEGTPPRLGMGVGLLREEEEEPVTSRAQARRKVKQHERELLAFHPALSTSSAASSGGGKGGSGAGSAKSLKEQLAAYGKSLRVEKELAEKEERERMEKIGKEGFTIEIVSHKAPAHPGRSAAASPSTIAATLPSSTAAPAWRAIPSTDRLAPPASALPAKRGPSPSTSTPSRQLGESVSAASRTPTTTPNKENSTASSPARPPSLASTTSGGKETTVPPALPSSPPVLGQGPGGISFVGVQPLSSSALRQHATPASSSSHPNPQPRTSRSSHSSDKGTAAGTGGGSSVTSVAAPGGKVSTRVQVEEDRKRKAELEGKVPKAVRTVPEKKKGLKRFFGGGGGK
ncbi:hypothetical protein JCM11641_008259 [Rhodosporidiobolus odoratus]